MTHSSQDSSYTDISSPHVSEITRENLSAMSSNTDQASRDFDRTKDEASRKADAAADKTSKEANKAASYTSDKAQQGKEKGEAAFDKVSRKAAEERDELSDNRDNPVVVGNMAIAVIGGIGLGVAGYNKYAKGELSWEVVGIAAAAVGALGVADYYVSQ